MADIIRPTGDIVTPYKLPKEVLRQILEQCKAGETLSSNRDKDGNFVWKEISILSLSGVQSTSDIITPYKPYQDGPEEVIDEAAYQFIDEAARQFGWQGPKVVPDCTCKTLLNGHENGCPFAKQER